MGTKINKYSKLTIYDRMTINTSLAKHHSLSQIARTIGCSPSTTYREITSNCKIRSGKYIMPCRLPKGHSLDFLTQEKVDLMFSHINSYVRKVNKEKSPYELVVRRMGTRFTHAINCKKIKPNNVLLKPELLK